MAGRVECRWVAAGVTQSRGEGDKTRAAAPRRSHADSLVMLTRSVWSLVSSRPSVSANTAAGLASLQVVMNNQRKIIWPGGETEKPQGFQMSTRLKVGGLGLGLGHGCHLHTHTHPSHVFTPQELHCTEKTHLSRIIGLFSTASIFVHLKWEKPA